MVVASYVTTTLPLACHTPQSPHVASTPVPYLSFDAMDKVKVLHCSRYGYFASAGLVDSARGTTSGDSPQGVWADADGGSGPNGREYNEEDEEVEENEFDFEGDDVAAVDKHGGNQYEDDLAGDQMQWWVSFKSLVFSTQKRKWSYEMRRLRSVEGDSLVPEQAESAPLEVSVPVSPSDMLAMYLQANGTLTESEIPRLTKALEETEGISNLKVQVLEGIGTVELTKHTTVQATGAASSLVEIIQGAGFKLQTLNLSFEAEEDILV